MVVLISREVDAVFDNLTKQHAPTTKLDEAEIRTRLEDSSMVQVATKQSNLLRKEVNNHIKNGALVIIHWWFEKPPVNRRNSPHTAYIFHKNQEARLRVLVDQIVQPIANQLHPGVTFSLHGIADIVHSNVPEFYQKNNLLARHLELFDKSVAVDTCHALAKLNPPTLHWLWREIDWGIDPQDLECLYTLNTENLPKSISAWQRFIDQSVRLDSLPVIAD